MHGQKNATHLQIGKTSRSNSEAIAANLLLVAIGDATKSMDSAETLDEHVDGSGECESGSSMRAWHVACRFLRVEIGLRGFIRMLLHYGFLALVAAALKAFSKDGFDWPHFWLYFLLLLLANFVARFLDNSPAVNKVLRPGAGHLYRDERKAMTAALLQRISKATRLTADKQVEEARKMLPDILDVIVLHIRDHRGCGERDKDVMFANVLLVDGQDLVVVARDSLSSSDAYRRPTPARYSMASIMSGRVVNSGKALSVGDLLKEYPEAPRQKPYRSIIGVPLLDCDSKVFGVLSVDSSIPYMFTSWETGQIENQIENSLLPYTRLLTMALELLVGLDRDTLIHELTSTRPAEGGERDRGDR